MATDRYTIDLTIDGTDNASSKFRNLNDQLDDLDDKSKNAGSGFNQLGTAIKGAAIGFLANELVGVVSDLNELGSRVSTVSATFEQLQGGADQAESALALLRSSTGGIVDDLTLMQGANSLFITGLASTAEEAANLTNIAVTLGGALGQDAAGSIENLNAALLNNSFQRLDTLGISAAAVRERVAELKEEGLDMSEAFAQAVMEEGAAAIDQLGTAATANITAVNQLGAAVQNLTQDVAEFVAAGLEVAAQSTLDLAGLIDIGLGGDADGRVRNSEITTPALENFTQSGNVLGFGLQQDRQFLSEIVDFQAENQELFDEIIATGFRSGGLGDERTAEIASLFGFDEINTDVLATLDSGFAAVANQLNVMEEAATDARNATRDLVTEARLEPKQLTDPNARLRSDSGAGGSVDVNFDVLARDEFITRANAINTAFADTSGHIDNATKSSESLFNQVDAVADTLIDFQNEDFAFLEELFNANTSQIGDNTFFNPDAIDDVVNQADLLQDRANEIAELAELTDFEIISEDEVSNAQELAEQARDYADAAITAADALERASLADIFGQSDGGRFAEIADSVLANIEDPEARAAAQREFDLASGQETGLSLAFEEQFAPLIAQITQELGADEATAAIQRLNESLTNTAALGLTEAERIAAAQQAIGFEAVQGTPEETVTVESGDSINAIAARTGFTPEEVREAAGGTNLIVPGQVLELGDGTTLVAIPQDGISEGRPITDDAPIGDGSFIVPPVAPASGQFAPIIDGAPLGSGQFISDTIAEEQAFFAQQQNRDAARGDGRDGGGLDGNNREGADGRTSTGFTEEDALNAERIDLSVQSIAEAALDSTFEDFNADTVTASGEVDGLVSRLETIGNLDLRAEVDLALILSNETGLHLKPLIREQINLVLQDSGTQTGRPS